jgi:hypothetical protein
LFVKHEVWNGRVMYSKRVRTVYNMASMGIGPL